jgi:glutathione S-transferase
MVLPVLYGNRESGHCYKVKLALCLLGIEHDYRPVDLQQPHTHRRPDFQQVSRFGEVPVLVENGVALVQSNAILLHLARCTGRLGGLEPERLTEWLFWEANRIGFSIANLRAACTYAADKTSAGVQAWLRGRALEDLSRLDLELAAHPFLLGERASMADLSCCAYLFWPEQAGLDLMEWPNVVCWLKRIQALPGWAAPYALLS